MMRELPFEKKESFESLISKDYVPAMYYGANRIYLDKKRSDLKDRFINVDDLVKCYDILVPYN